MTGRKSRRKLVREIRGGEPYEYFPLGEYVVIAPGVCGGRPTFKGTRLEVRVILNLLAAGWTVEKILEQYSRSDISAEAVAEAVRLASTALVTQAEVLAA